MKKFIMILLAAVAFGCGDGNRSSERDDAYDENTEVAEPADSTNVASDTTSTDDVDRDEAGTERDSL